MRLIAKQGGIFKSKWGKRILSPKFNGKKFIFCPINESQFYIRLLLEILNF